MAFTTPQAEQVLEEGYQRSATCTVVAAQPVLYSIWRRSSPQPTPATWRARRRLRSIPATPEVLDHYRAVLADEPGGQLVQAAAAGVGDSGVEFRDSGLGLAPPLRGHLSRALVGADTPGRLGAAGDAAP